MLQDLVARRTRPEHGALRHDDIRAELCARKATAFIRMSPPCYAIEYQGKGEQMRTWEAKLSPTCHRDPTLRS